MLASLKRRARIAGQALAEFALVFPILFLVVAAIIQFGLVFWAQNTLTQVARDTGRFAATLQLPCGSAAAEAEVLDAANDIAQASTLFGYKTAWTSPGNVDATWSTAVGVCPPVGNQQVSYVTITLHHAVPIFFPFLPISGDLTTQAEFRMEPVSE